MLNGKKIVLVLILTLGYVFLFQMAFGMDPYEIENCEKEIVESEVICDPYSLDSRAERLKREKEQSRFYVDDFNSWDEGWPHFFIDSNVVFNWAYGYQRNPTMAWGGDNYLVVWEEYLSNYYLLIEYNIYCSLVSPAGDILDTIAIPISTGPGDQLFPSVVSNDIGYFVVWSDKRSGNLDIYGARVSLDGSVLDPDGILIWTTSNNELRPSVAWDGTNYLVVWQGIQPGIPTTSIYGALVNSEGEILDEYPIFVSNDTLKANYNPFVAWDGTNYLVVWEDSGG